MLRIDLLGANGVGKSTVMKALKRRRQTRDRGHWKCPREVKQVMAARQWQREGGVGGRARAMVCRLPKLGPILAEGYLSRLAGQAFVEKGAEVSHFYNTCLRGAVETEGGAGEHVGLGWLFEALKEVCLLDPWNGTVVFDESLTHELVGLLVGLGAVDLVRDWFEAMPKPDAVIYVSGNEELVWERLKDRKARRGTGLLRHRRLSEESKRNFVRRSLRVVEEAASTLMWRGVPIVEVDGGSPPEVNAEVIDRSLVDIVGGCRPLGATPALVRGGAGGYEREQ